METSWTELEPSIWGHRFTFIFCQFYRPFIDHCERTLTSLQISDEPVLHFKLFTHRMLHYIALVEEFVAELLCWQVEIKALLAINLHRMLAGW